MTEHTRRPREAIGIVDRVTTTGTIFLHEADTGKLGYIANTTPISATVRVVPGTKLRIAVDDRGDVMIVESAEALA